MPYKFNPFTQTLDETPGLVTSTNAGLLPAGFSYENDVFNVPGDINLDDGVAGFETTLQTITPTANRTISFPDASGTVALIGGTNGQVTYNAAGAQAGLPTLTTDGTNLTLAGRLTNTFTSLADAPAKLLSGTWFTGGTPTTNKPHFLIEPAGTTSTTWSTLGTGLGVNAASGFTGNLLDLQLNGTSWLGVKGSGGGTTLSTPLDLQFNVTGLVAVSFPNTSNRSLRVRHTADIGWCQGGNLNDPSDLTLFRDAANTLAQRNSTNAQTYRVYNTWTSSTNNELGKLEWSSNVFRIGTEKGSGGGVARSMAFQTDGITRATVTTDGYLRMAAGTGGIQFNGDTAAANALDDYEEGAWTPELAFGGASTGITYNARQGYYVKIGKQVFLTVYFNLASKGTATGSATVTGLPFTAEDFNIAGTSNWPGAAPSRRQNETSTNFAMMVGDNTATIFCTNGGGIAITDAAFTNGTIIECALTYRAA